jgi:hypothetical protein
MAEPIDVEFEIIHDPRPRPVTTWTFWEDDFPNLARIVGGAVTAGVLVALFHGPWRGIYHWFG